MTCSNSYDTLTQAAGQPLPNEFVVSADPTTELLNSPVVTSYCRVADGTWVAWYQNDTGDSLSSGPFPEKSVWPGLVASANPISVGYFADDGSAPVVYELGLEWPCFTWKSGTYSSADICSILVPAGVKFANDQQSIMTAWFTSVLDVQVRTDGTNVWVVALARETVTYPYITNKRDADRCGFVHIGIETVLINEGANVFTQYAGNVFDHDTDRGTRWWQHFGSGTTLDDDAGIDNSFRWQPARVTVWAGDVGGFTRLDSLNAVMQNDATPSGTKPEDGKISFRVEAAASPAEPGVLHVMWAEGGWQETYLGSYGERLSYSRWDTARLLLESNVADAWTGEFILRNDHGSPIAFVSMPDPATGIVGPLEMWDLSAGTPTVLQTLTPDLVPTPTEAGMVGTPFQFSLGSENASQTTGVTRSMFASSLYTDPLLGNRDVYLISIPYADPLSSARCVSFYRVPCDGSAGFDFLDGLRLVNYSIVPDQFGSSGVSLFHADFVSDPDNIWMPSTEAALNFTLGGVMHLDRQCIRGWEHLTGFPIGDPAFGFATADFSTSFNNTSPPAVLSRSDGDWLVGGGIAIPAGTDPSLSGSDANLASIEAKICRCCLPCNRTGMHVWEIV